MARAINWTRYDRLKAQGLTERAIARELDIPWTSFWRELQRREAQPAEAHQGTPAADQARHTPAHPSTPAVRQRHTRAHLGTPATHPTRVHPGTPAEPPAGVHPSPPLPPELVRMLALLPDLEALVARERDRQRLLSTPLGIPRHTVKKTYVVEQLYVDLIERYAQAEGLELKAVLNLALHEFFERRHYLPQEAP
jgi:hypothetical protein